MMGVEELRGSVSKNFDLTGYEECFSPSKFFAPCVPSSSLTCSPNVFEAFFFFQNRPPFDTSHTNLDYDKNLFMSFHISTRLAESFQLSS